MLTPSATLRYSGMVPGWISGQYDRDDGLVDLAALARRAGADFVQGMCTGIDPDKQHVRTDTGRDITYDLCSIDTGGVGRAKAVLGDDPRVIDVRPIDGFVEQIEALPKRHRIAVIGGGAGGVELAFALRNRRNRGNGRAGADLTLITGGNGLLPDFSRAVRAKVSSELEAQGIAVIAADAHIESGTLMAGRRRIDAPELIVAALGSAAPQWPRDSGLACDPAGFVAVDQHQRSISHPHVFAVGDVASRQDITVPHSGVHAVFAGPVLAGNLRAAAAGLPPAKVYRPRLASLYLMSTGRGEAIASYGPLAMQGRWAAKLKHWIDTRWLRQYARLSS